MNVHWEAFVSFPRCTDECFRAAYMHREAPLKSQDASGATYKVQCKQQRIVEGKKVYGDNCDMICMLRVITITIVRGQMPKRFGRRAKAEMPTVLATTLSST